MRRIVVVALLSLAACGQPQPASPPTTSSTPATGAAAPSTQIAPEVIAERIAALPAPYNAGDYDAGKRVFGQCRACHTVNAGGVNRVGPNLHGVFGRRAGSVEDFKTYSQALKDSGIVWDAASLDKWSANPREMAPANNMVFPGLRQEKDRIDMIAYLAAETTN